MTENFHDYLYGITITVFTDNNPLTYVLTTAKLDETGHRWLASLAAYDFDIVYRPGQSNVDADAMSRLPGLRSDEDGSETQVSSESVQAICSVVQSQPYIESLCKFANVVYVELNRGQDIRSMT